MTPIAMPAFAPLDNPLEGDAREGIVVVGGESMLVLGTGVFVSEFPIEVEEKGLVVWSVVRGLLELGVVNVDEMSLAPLYQSSAIVSGHHHIL